MKLYKEISKGILSAVTIIALIVTVIFFMWEVRAVVAYIFIAFALSLMGRPLMTFINEKIHLSRTLSAMGTMTIIFCLFSLFIYLFIPLIARQANNLSLLDTSTLQKTIVGQIKTADEALKARNIYLFNGNYNNLINTKIEYNLKPETLQGSVSLFFGLGISVFSILFITFFFLREKDLFNNMIISIVPEKDEEKANQSLLNIKKLLTRYFLGLLMQVFSMFMLYLIILLCFGIEDAIVIAFLCACLNLIPYFGPMVGFFIINLLSMSSMFSDHLNVNMQIFPNMIWISILYCIAQIIDNIVIQPLIYAKSVKSHPLEIFIVMLMAGILFGTLGVIFAIPGYTVIRVILKNFFSEVKFVRSLTKNL